jgi:hypothetical protein
MFWSIWSTMITSPSTHIGPEPTRFAAGATAGVASASLLAAAGTGEISGSIVTSRRLSERLRDPKILARRHPNAPEGVSRS